MERFLLSPLTFHLSLISVKILTLESSYFYLDSIWFYFLIYIIILLLRNKPPFSIVFFLARLLSIGRAQDLGTTLSGVQNLLMALCSGFTFIGSRYYIRYRGSKSSWQHANNCPTYYPTSLTPSITFILRLKHLPHTSLRSLFFLKNPVKWPILDPSLTPYPSPHKIAQCAFKYLGICNTHLHGEP